MDVVIALCGQWGHIIPTLPVGLALRGRGHRVRYAFVDHPPLNELVDRHGFERVPLSLTRVEETAIMQAGTEQVLAMEPAQRDERALATWFAPLAERMLDDLVDLAQTADVVIHENTTFAAPLAAAVAGIPSVLHGTGAATPEAVRHAAHAMAPAWKRAGVAMRSLAGLAGELHLDVFPPSIPNPAAELSPRRQPLRPEPPQLADGDPPWLAERNHQPLVLVTLGTNFNRDTTLWATVLEALARAPVTVVAATGPGNDLRERLPSLPPNVLAHEFVPLGPLLRSAAAVITHAGAGTTLAALALGKPLILCPQGADQPYIAERVIAVGAGVRLQPDTADEQVMAILDNDAVKNGAERVRAEISAMPSATDVAPVIEHLVETRTPTGPRDTG